MFHNYQKRLSSLLLITILVSGCANATNAPNLTPVARNAYNLTQLVDSIGILQLAAEKAVPSNILKVNTARLIVQFCVSANTTIGASPNGWFAIVNAAYAQTKSQLTVDELTKFGPYLSSFEIILATFGS